MRATDRYLRPFACLVRACSHREPAASSMPWIFRLLRVERSLESTMEPGEERGTCLKACALQRARSLLAFVRYVQALSEQGSAALTYLDPTGRPSGDANSHSESSRCLPPLQDGPSTSKRRTSASDPRSIIPEGRLGSRLILDSIEKLIALIPIKTNGRCREMNLVPSLHLRWERSVRRVRVKFKSSSILYVQFESFRCDR